MLLRVVEATKAFAFSRGLTVANVKNLKEENMVNTYRT